MSEKEFVIPGSFLGAEEEFSPGMNTCEDSEGNIYSSCVGEKNLDLKKREVNVIKKTKIVKPLEAGSVVLGRVELVKDQVAILDLIDAKKDSEPRTISGLTAIIPIFNVSSGYVKNMECVFRVGDIVRAKVTEITQYSIELTTKEEGFGVVKAFCVKCRQKLLLFGSKLKCSNCGNPELRKISGDYLLK